MMETAHLSEVIGRFPATSAQQRFWFQEQAKPGDIELNIAVRWEIRGTFRVDDIGQAFRQITDRHEVLRTCFVEDGGELWQEVVDRVEFRLGVVDLRAVAESEHDLRVAEMARELAAQPFDLSTPSQMRITLVRLAHNRAALQPLDFDTVADAGAYALRMAQKLTDAGEQVVAVSMIDALLRGGFDRAARIMETRIVRHRGGRLHARSGTATDAR